MSDSMMIQELRKKREELQAESAVIDAKLAAINTVIDMFEGKGQEKNQEALSLETSEEERQMSEVLEFSSPTKPKSGSSSSSKSERSSTNGHPKKIAISQEVREAVKECEGQFGTQDIVQRIQSKYPGAEVKRTPVSTALGRMVKRNQGIRVARESESWEPNIYERVSDDTDARKNHVTEEDFVSS